MMPHHVSRRAFNRALLPLAAGLLVSLGCAEDQGPSNKCVAPVAIAISEGTQPTVSWEPRCLVFSVSVAPLVEGEIPTAVWQVISPIGILPPVDVGGSPSQAFVLGAGTTLVAGTSYRLYVSRGAKGGDPNGLADSLTFTAGP